MLRDDQPMRIIPDRGEFHPGAMVYLPGQVAAALIANTQFLYDLAGDYGFKVTPIIKNVDGERTKVLVEVTVGLCEAIMERLMKSPAFAPPVATFAIAKKASDG